jgi:hypothetical protein
MKNKLAQKGKIVQRGTNWFSGKMAYRKKTTLYPPQS